MVKKYKITLDSFVGIKINKEGDKNAHNTYTLISRASIYYHDIRISKNQNIFYEFIKFQKILNEIHNNT